MPLSHRARVVAFVGNGFGLCTSFPRALVALLSITNDPPSAAKRAKRAGMGLA